MTSLNVYTFNVHGTAVAKVVALWYICIIKSFCGLLKVLVVCLLTFSTTDTACTKALGHCFITFLLLLESQH